MDKGQIEQEIIKLAHKVCKANFMDYPDYDDSIELSVTDALTIFVMDFTFGINGGKDSLWQGLLGFIYKTF